MTMPPDMPYARSALFSGHDGALQEAIREVLAHARYAGSQQMPTSTRAPTRQEALAQLAFA